MYTYTETGAQRTIPTRRLTLPTRIESYKRADDPLYIEMVSSPCINVCTVEDGVCTACNRTLEDIANWAAMTEAERIERMADLDVPADS